MNQFVAFTDRAHALAAAGARADALFGNSSSPTSNPQTRRTYGCSITEFLAWCEQNGLASIIDRAAIWGMSVECTHGPDRRQRSRTPARFVQEGTRWTPRIYPPLPRWRVQRSAG
jgi:hypothetical protein